MGRAQQAKGRRAEIELARLLQERGLDVKPGDPCNHGRTPDIVGLRGVHCEVKRHEKLNVYAALRQAAEDAARFGDGLPIVAHRANRCGWVVSMTIDDFLSLYERTQGELKETPPKGAAKPEPSPRKSKGEPRGMDTFGT